MSEANSKRTRVRNLYAKARRMTASPLLYIGAVTIVGANEIAEWFVEWAVLSKPIGALILFPITLVLVYGQLIALAYYEQKGYRRGYLEE